MIKKKFYITRMKRTHYSRPLVVKLNRIDPDKVMRYFILLNEK